MIEDLCRDFGELKLEQIVSQSGIQRSVAQALRQGGVYVLRRNRAPATPIS